jgi:predicted flap endonuclease-1-like 5' DNA nuclease
MQYLVATYWMWFAVALLMGGAVGYWLPGRQVAEDGISHLLRWGVPAFLLGLAVAVLHVYPLGDEGDIEMVLLPAVCFALGGLLGRWLRAASARAELARATLAGNAHVESAVLGARAKAAVRSIQDVAVSAEAKAAGEARLAEATKVAAAKAAAVKAAAAMAAVAKAAEEVRLAAEARTAEQARLAAVTKAAEQARLAAETKAAEEARVATVAKTAVTETAEEVRPAAETRAAEEARLAAAVNAVQQERLATEAKAAEETRVAAVAITAVTETAEEVRPAAETKAAEEARLAAAVNAVQQERLATEAKAAEQARRAAADKAAEDIAAQDKAAQEPGVAATTAQAGAFHPGSRPPGIAAPVEGESDDLKRIKGMGPETEKACNALGICQFRQIANWTPEEAIWVGHHIGFPGRIEREHWIVQARLLASGGETEHSRAVKSGFVDHKADEPLDPAAAEILGKSLPEQAAAVDGEDKHPGRRPYGLATPLGKPDNLKRIRGIGPQNEGRLHGLGIWHVSQIAAWTDENVKWVGSYLGSSGRIQRDNWVTQARDLAAGKGTESSRRVAASKVPPPKDDGSLGQDNVQTSK